MAKHKKENQTKTALSQARLTFGLANRSRVIQAEEIKKKKRTFKEQHRLAVVVQSQGTAASQSVSLWLTSSLIDGSLFALFALWKDCSFAVFTLWWCFPMWALLPLLQSTHSRSFSVSLLCPLVFFSSFSPRCLSLLFNRQKQPHCSLSSVHCFLALILLLLWFLFWFAVLLWWWWWPALFFWHLCKCFDDDGTLVVMMVVTVVMMIERNEKLKSNLIFSLGEWKCPPLHSHEVLVILLTVLQIG